MPPSSNSQNQSPLNPEPIQPQAPNPTVVSPATSQNPAYNSGQTPIKVIRVPKWLISIFALPLFVLLIVLVLVSVSSFRSYERSNNLKRLGVSGQAYVTSAETSTTNYGSSNTASSATTNISYRLLNVPGYENKTFNASLSVSRNQQMVTKGQTISVTYSPKNPSDNEVTSNLATTSLTFIFLVIFMVIFCIGIGVVIVAIKQFKKRRQIIQGLSN